MAPDRTYHGVTMSMPTTPDLTPERVLDLAAVRELSRTGRARELRLAADLSLYEVARAIGVSAATVQRWEVGERRPHGEAALRYAALLEALVERAAARRADGARAA